jgi:hypothetical protein
MGLKFMPAEGTQRVAPVDSNDGKEEVDEIRAADGFPKLGAAELAEVEAPAEMIEEVSGHKDTESGEERFPRLQCHEKAEYGDARGGVKRG